MLRSDSAREIETPEGCGLTLRLAGPFVRSRAFLIDAALRGVILLLIGQGLALTGKLGPGLFALVAFGLEWFYPIIFEVFSAGATPGKRVCKLTVLRDDGTPVDWGASFVRNTLRAVDFLPVLYGVGLLAMLLGNGFQRIGDLAAGTVVVFRDEPPIALPPSTDLAATRSALPLLLQEQRALIDFVRRAPSLTPERGAELALLAGPLVRGLEPAAARDRLLALGRYLIGHSGSGT